LLIPAILGGATLLYGLSHLSKATEAEAEQEAASVGREEAVNSVEEESVMEEMKAENIKDVMASRDNKLIYFYRSQSQNKEEFKKVEEHALKMYNGLKVKPYKIDLDTYFNDFSAFLKERNPKMADHVEEQMKNNTFLLANQYDDIWFWELDFINYFYGDLLE